VIIAHPKLNFTKKLRSNRDQRICIARNPFSYENERPTAYGHGTRDSSNSLGSGVNAAPLLVMCNSYPKPHQCLSNAHTS
jgi:hypothetical protein